MEHPKDQPKDHIIPYFRQQLFFYNSKLINIFFIKLIGVSKYAKIFKFNNFIVFLILQYFVAYLSTPKMAFIGDFKTLV